jgi:hypothetical protein
MDYLKIVLEGYILDNNRKYLVEYFVREQKKASKEYYSAEEFFSGCKSVVQQFTEEIKRQLYKEKNNCYFAIEHIKNRTMTFSQPDSSLTYEEQCEKALEIWEDQLAGWTMDSFSVNLFSLNNGYTGYLWNSDLLYISNAIEKAKSLILMENDIIADENKNNKNIELIESIVKGIKELQSQDVNAECIKIVKRENRNLEAPFRNWFKTFFASKYDYVNAEPEKGNGRIDLKIEDSKLGTVIIEFKGWWNNDKKQVISQISSYLTDFESEGFIIIINNKHSDINDEYFKLIKSETTHYLENSYEEVLYKNTEYRYFKSRHKDGIRTKTLYHFILNVY